MVRLRYLTLGLVALCGAASAYSQVTADESVILAAYQKLSDSPTIVIESDGTEIYLNKTRHFKTIASWSYDRNASVKKAQLEIQQYQDDVLVQRLLGDGENFYAYDLVRREFSAINYGGYGNPSTDFTAKLIQLANQSAKGQGRYVVQFLNDVVALDGAARYRSWIAGVKPIVLNDGVSQDPVLSWRQYIGTPAIHHTMYSIAPKRSIVVRLEDDDTTGTQSVTAIYFNERETVSKADRETDWTMLPVSGVGTFDSSLFAPYTADQVRGWRAVVGPQPFRTG